MLISDTETIKVVENLLKKKAYVEKLIHWKDTMCTYNICY